MINILLKIYSCLFGFSGAELDEHTWAEHLVNGKVLFNCINCRHGFLVSWVIQLTYAHLIKMYLFAKSTSESYTFGC